VVIRWHSPPQYAHVCDACADCTWLGRDTYFDLYVCRSEARGVVLLARYGRRVNDFATLSITHYKGNVDELTYPFDVAYLRAKQAGVIDG
jgi:hypothetical protein